MNEIRKTGLKLLTLTIVLGWMAACSGGHTLKEVKNAQGKGTLQVYKIPFQQVWDSVPDAVQHSGPVVVESNQFGGYFLAQDPPSAFDSGENIVIYVKKKGEGETEVEVISQKAGASMFTSNSEASILQSINVKLWERYGGVPDEKKEP